MSLPAVGEVAPDFELQTEAGETLSLSDLRGKRVVLFFYPKADTPGCTKEACGFRDEFDGFEDRGVVVLGISPDSVKRQSNFQSKYNLPYHLLADRDHKVAALYGVWGLKKLIGREYEGVNRTTFIIDENGKISNVFQKVKPEGHSKEILQALE